MIDNFKFAELAAARHSTRRFNDSPVSEDVLQQLLAAASLAPASKGVSSSECVVTVDHAVIEALSACKASGASFVKHATAVIAVTGKPSISDMWVENASIVSTYLLLMAESMGLGSCWVQVRGRSDASGVDAEDNVRRIMGLSADSRVLSLIALGHPESR